MSELWEFACETYAHPGVEAACLQLQEQGNDVCLLLCCAWLGKRGVAYEATRLAALHAIATPWRREVIEPMRALRLAWRANAQADDALHALREQVKALELQGERELLERLERAATAWPPFTSGMQPWLDEAAICETADAQASLDTLKAAVG
ncbi:TIGR02444 family protein [Pseudomonas sp. Marseille-QA0892]